MIFSLVQKISYAKGKSDAVSKVDGTFKADKKKRKQPPSKGTVAVLANVLRWVQQSR